MSKKTYIQVVIKRTTAMHDISTEDDNACIQFTDSKTRIISKCVSDQSSTYTMN